MMPSSFPPKPPPFNDQLMQALSPINQMLSSREKVENIMRKYGQGKPSLPKRNFNGPPAVPREALPND